MKFMLDANAVIAITKRNHRFGERMRRQPMDDIVISAIGMYELYFGAFRSERVAENLAALRALPFEVLDFDMPAAELAGEIRTGPMRAGEIIGPYDLMIAGHALSRDLVLVTHNTREFSRVPGLRVEDWEA